MENKDRAHEWAGNVARWPERGRILVGAARATATCAEKDEEA